MIFFVEERTAVGKMNAIVIPFVNPISYFCICGIINNRLVHTGNLRGIRNGLSGCQYRNFDQNICQLFINRYLTNVIS